MSCATSCSGRVVWVVRKDRRWENVCSCELGAEELTRGLDEGTIVRTFEEIPDPGARAVWPPEWTWEEWKGTFRGE